jgi:hypothetical protein
VRFDLIQKLQTIQPIFSPEYGLSGRCSSAPVRLSLPLLSNARSHLVQPGLGFEAGVVLLAQPLTDAIAAIAMIGTKDILMSNPNWRILDHFPCLSDLVRPSVFPTIYSSAVGAWN